MALGLVFAIFAVLTTVTGHFFPAAGIRHAQAVDGTMLLFMAMIATSLGEFHYSGRWKSNACRR